MPDETEDAGQPGIDILVPSDSNESGDDDVAKVAGEVDATIDKVLDQAYTRAHEDWLGVRALASAGDQFMNETNRWSMQAAASNQLFLASGILAQRSAQAQPQQLPGPGGTAPA